MTHGGDELRKASPCPLCFNPIAARELRLARVLRIAPVKARLEACVGCSRISLSHAASTNSCDGSPDGSRRCTVRRRIRIRSVMFMSSMVAAGGTLWPPPLALPTLLLLLGWTDADALPLVVQVGDAVTFQLLRRSKTSIIPLVIGEEDAGSKTAGGSPTRKTQSAAAMATADGGLADGSKAPSAWAAKRVRHADDRGVKSVDEGAASPPDCNRFAKFAAASDAAPLWQRAARELAQYAAQVLVCGGTRLCAIARVSFLHPFMNCCESAANGLAITLQAPAA